MTDDTKISVAIAVAVMRGVMVEVVVLTTVDAVKVVVDPVTPAHEQADEYRTVPEQAEAYVGTFVCEPVVAAQVPAGGDEVVEAAAARFLSRMVSVMITSVGSTIVAVSSMVVTEVKVSMLVMV